MIVNGNIAINALIRVVAGREDHIYSPRVKYNDDDVPYSTCVYAHDGCPDCGVGQALAELGMSVGELYWMDGLGENTQIAVATMPSGWYLTTTARKIFAGFQQFQDRGCYTWGDALDRAKLIAVNPNNFSKYGAFK